VSDAFSVSEGHVVPSDARALFPSRFDQQSTTS